MEGRLEDNDINQSIFARISKAAFFNPLRMSSIVGELTEDVCASFNNASRDTDCILKIQ